MPCGRAPRRKPPFLHGREEPLIGALTAMPEPPTPITHPASVRGGNGATANGSGSRPPVPPPPVRKPKLKKLRLAFILVGLTCAGSGIDGVRDADGGVERFALAREQGEYRAAENSRLYADGPGCKEPGQVECQIAKLTGNENRILVKEGEVSPNIKNAVIAIEDRRFYEHEGVDYSGIARALFQDILKRSAVQGGSTITQQFVKNALSAQSERTVFQKLRESALAYHLERQWPKEKILTQYLNTVYFGNGAYGIEAAVRTYFGDGDEPDELDSAENVSGVQYAPPPVTGEDETNPNARESEDVTPAEAAMLAGLIASPSLYDPVENPRNATERRNLVLSRMREQGHDHARPVPGGHPPVGARRGRGRPAHDRVRAALLHELDDPAAGGPLPARPGLQRRPEDQDHHRPRDAGRRRECGGRTARRRGAGRVARCHREQDRRGQGHGRRLELQRATLQPRYQRASPARLLVQALHPACGP